MLKSHCLQFRPIKTLRGFGIDHSRKLELNDDPSRAEGSYDDYSFTQEKMTGGVQSNFSIRNA